MSSEDITSTEGTKVSSLKGPKKRLSYRARENRALKKMMLNKTSPILEMPPYF